MQLQKVLSLFFHQGLRIILVVQLFFSFSGFSLAESAASQKTSTLPPGIATLGGRASVDDTDGFIDVLDPIWGSEEAFLFINPRASLSGNSANEENIGLGARKLIMEDRAIVGGNLFYDNRESEYGNRFHQLGVGVELLTEWVDFRANYYLPEKDQDLIASGEIQEVQSRVVSTTLDETPVPRGNAIVQEGIETIETVTTTHHLDKFESAMEGIDFEVGLKLPILTQVFETRAYGGYYFYDARYGDELKGFKARLEVRAAPGLIMDAEWYEDKELHGSDWYVGARVRLPFDIGNIFQRKNPFEGAREYFKPSTKPLKARMTDMVMRDIDIIREESEFIEDPAKLKIEKELTQKSFEVTLQGGIIFVDGDRGSGNGKTLLPWEGAGTFEDPYTTIQAAVNASSKGGIVYVDHAKEPYYENVKLKDGMILWGSGVKIFGFESGKYPVVKGQGSDASIEMENGTTVQGMKVTHSGSGVGIYAKDKTNLTVTDDIIEGTAAGIKFEGEGGASQDFATLISGNVIQGNTVGIQISEHDHNIFYADISGNTVSNNLGKGIAVSGSARTGLLDPSEPQSASLYVSMQGNTEVNDNGSTNIDLDLATEGGHLVVFLSGNGANRSVAGSGVSLKAKTEGVGLLNALVYGNIVTDNDNSNAILDLETSDGGLVTDLSGNDFSRSVDGKGLEIKAKATGLGAMNAFVYGNTANGNHDTNIYLDLDTNEGFLYTALGASDFGEEFQTARNFVSDGHGKGIELHATVNGSSAYLFALLTGNTAERNGDTNILANLNTNGGDLEAYFGRSDLGLLGNQASEGGGKGIELDASVTGGPGLLKVKMEDNFVDNNADTNIDINLKNAEGRVYDENVGLEFAIWAEITGNEAKNSKEENGISLFTETGSSAAYSLVRMFNNEFDNNKKTNALLDLHDYGQGIATGIFGNSASGSGERGISLTQMSHAGILVALMGDAERYNTVNLNQEQNIYADLESFGEMLVEINGNKASGSLSSAGIEIEANADRPLDPGTLSSIAIQINDNILEGNAGHNVDVTLVSTDGGIDLDLSRNKTSQSKGGSGILLDASIVSGDGGISATLEENTSNKNKGDNMDVHLSAANGPLDVTFSKNEANNSLSGSGLELDLKSAGDVAAQWISNSFDNNGINGLDIQINEGIAVSGKVSLLAEKNFVRNNANDGVSLNMNSGASSYVLDFGGGALGSKGENSFSGNGVLQLNYLSPASGVLIAKSNWWGSATESPKVSPCILEIVPCIDTSNSLGSEPQK